MQGERGYYGPKGEIGYTGATGIRGIDGPTGPVGPIGPIGPIGLKGDASNTGATGTTGPTGDIGNTGNTGPTGPEGRFSAIDAQRLSDLENTIYAGPSGGNNGYPLNYRGLQPFTFMGFINDIYYYCDNLNNYVSAARNIADDSHDRVIKAQKTADGAQSTATTALILAGTVAGIGLTVGGIATAVALNQGQIAAVGGAVAIQEGRIGGIEADLAENGVLLEEQAENLLNHDEILAGPIAPGIQRPPIQLPPSINNNGGLI
eukprot:gene37979-49779_t